MSLINLICSCLELGRELCLVSLVSSDAAPRSAGACMLCGRDGILGGTVGGGLMEKEAEEAAKRVIASGKAEFLDWDPSRDSQSMTSGGKLRLFLEPIRPDGPTKTAYLRVKVAHAHGDSMFAVVPAVAPGRRRVCRAEADKWPLPTELSHIMRGLKEKNALNAPVELYDSHFQRFIIEPWPAPWRVVLMGAGHVAQATAECVGKAGFATCVVDDREEFISAERFPNAAIRKHAPDLEDALKGMSVTPKTFILVATHAHELDAKALAQALGTNAAFIGMLGSARKFSAIAEKLKEQGLESELPRVTCPVGLSVGAETPWEIGVSVAAQLIAARALAEGKTKHLDKALAGTVGR